MKSSDAFPSKYLKASDLQGRQVTVRMTHVDPEVISGDKKFILYFSGKTKGMVLNKTNWNNIAKVYGDDSDDWSGQEIVLFEAIVDFQGESVPAIRVKGPSKPAQSQNQHRPRPQASEMQGDEPPPRQSAPHDDMADEIPF